MSNKVIIAGSGISGLSAGAYLSQKGFKVEIFEKNDSPGGRLGHFTADGFTFNSGPLWYWFPEIIKFFFSDFSKNTDDILQPQRLDPAFRIHFSANSALNIPANKEKLIELFNSIEKAGGAKLEKYLYKAKGVYNTIQSHIDDHSANFGKLNYWNGLLLRPHKRYLHSLFRDQRLITLLEYPIPYFGFVPMRNPLLSYVTNYSLLEQGLFAPKEGMYRLVESLVELLDEYEVPIHLSSAVESFDIIENKVSGIITHGKNMHADYFVAATDYHHAEHLLPKEFRNYPERKWNLEWHHPMTLIIYIGISKKLTKIAANTLYLDKFENQKFRLFKPAGAEFTGVCHISCPSKNYSSLAPKGMETVVIRMSIPKGIEDTGKMREHYFHNAIRTLEHISGENITDYIVYKRTYASADFAADYNTFQGNAYGGSGSLAMLNDRKIKIQNQHLFNMFYAERPSFFGAGVPAALLAGKAVAEAIERVHVKTHS